MNGVLLVLTTAAEGREDEYNEWYSGPHLKEIVELDGFRSAQRFVVSSAQRGNVPYKYMALYEVEESQLEIAAEALRQANKNNVVVMSDTLDRDFGAWWYRPITDVVTS
jgi:hypothetical protein